MSSPSGRPSPRPRPGPGAPTGGVPPVARSTAPSSPPVTASGDQSSGTAPARPDPTADQAKKGRPPRTEPRFDPTSWLGAILVMIVFGAILWAVQIVNAANHYQFNRFGIVPRQVHGLWGILLTPFLHQSYRDMLADTLPVVLIGWVVLLAGVRIWLAVTVVVTVVGGVLTWLIGPNHLGHHEALIVGSSGLVFGWIGYLVARAIFSRKIKWILTAAMVLLVFGALLGQLVPVSHSEQAWQWHVAGFVAGAAIGALLHPRRPRRRAERPPRAASAVS